MGMDKLWESKQKLDQINHPHIMAAEETVLGGRFEAIYLEREVYDQLQSLRGHGYS